MTYTYGPVPSRRFGLSLGVDILPYKTCTVDCLYCQLGRTSNLTLERKSFFPREEILAEILSVSNQEKPDCITFSGSGEPPLNIDLGWLVSSIKKELEIKVIALTNSTILWMPDVREDLKLTDIVIPSLDAGTDAFWKRVNRPHPDLEFEKMIDGLTTFSHEFAGELWVEVLLVKGINDSEENIDSILNVLSRMKYVKVHLNTITRPPSETSLLALSHDELRDIAKRFPPNTEILSAFQKRGKHVSSGGDKERILNAASKQSVSLKNIEELLGIPSERAGKALEELVKEGKIKLLSKGGEVFYEALGS